MSSESFGSSDLLWYLFSILWALCGLLALYIRARLAKGLETLLTGIAATGNVRDLELEATEFYLDDPDRAREIAYAAAKKVAGSPIQSICIHNTLVFGAVYVYSGPDRVLWIQGWRRSLMTTVSASPRHALPSNDLTIFLHPPRPSIPARSFL